jgi:hypothetical protein
MGIERKALSLAAVLAATVLTGGAAVLGLTRNVAVTAPPAAGQPAAVQTVLSSPSEEGDG